MATTGYLLVDRRDLSEHDRLILKVLQLYYEHDLTQADIARRMGFSRPKVSKLIAEGRERGLVRIEIAEPFGDFSLLEVALENRYGLAEAVVVPSEERRLITDLLAGSAGGALLARVCRPTTVLGISWGRSLRALVDAVSPRAFACKKILPLVGGMGKAETDLHSNELCATFAERLGVDHGQLAAPAIAPSARFRAELMSTPGIGDILAEGAACDATVVGIGGVLPTSTVVGAEYFTLGEFLGLKEHGAVGDVCCHFLDAEGNPCLPELSERIVGLTLEQLRAIPKTIGIATGAEKGPGVAAVLRGSYVDVLITDQELAEGLLELAP